MRVWDLRVGWRSVLLLHYKKSFIPIDTHTSVLTNQYEADPGKNLHRAICNPIRYCLLRRSVVSSNITTPDRTYFAMKPENADLIPKTPNLGGPGALHLVLFPISNCLKEKSVHNCKVEKLDDGESFQNLCLLYSNSQMIFAYGRC